VTGDYIVAVITAVAVGLLDWFVIPAMGFSDTMKYLGVALEPALSVLLVLWVIRLARR
jgi:branched-subunit amino acid transport protein AzlD